MEELLKQMFEAAKRDKFLLRKLKELAIRTQQFELAAEIRNQEKALFPTMDEETEAHRICNLLSMVGVDASQAVSWRIWKTINVYIEKGQSISIQDTSLIRSESRKIFGE